MLYNLTIAKRLMKKAYKSGGLVVGITHQGWFHVSGGWWTICQDITDTPKQFKAAVIELCGDLPEKGTAYRAVKGESNQMMLDMEHLFVLPYKWKDILDSGHGYAASRIILESGEKQYRVIESNEGHPLRMVNDEAFRLVDADAVDYECGETAITGPLAKSPEDDAMIWYNNRAWFELMPVIVDEYSLSELLQTLNYIAGALGTTVYNPRYRGRANDSAYTTAAGGGE